MRNNKRKNLYKILILVITIVGGILYLLADRYLIQRVEVEDVTVVEAAAAQALSPTLEVTPASQIDELDIVDISNTVTSDDWHYVDSNTSITIDQVSTGTGKNKVTYFVADVILSDAAELRSAFADNQFGRNIIEYTSVIASENNAVFAINGDYYGFRTNGIVIRNGVLYRDVPARTGLAFFKDGSMRIYDETQTSGQELLDEGALNSLSFGPALLENSVISTDFDNYVIDRNLGNHPIQGNQPRTGVGIIDKNHFVFVVVDGRSTGYSRGVSLEEFAQIFKDLGCTNAYNLDGGGSSTMYFMGRVVNNPLGENKERGTSDILFIG